jgi:hypothetical protein
MKLALAPVGLFLSAVFLLRGVVGFAAGGTCRCGDGSCVLVANGFGPGKVPLLTEAAGGGGDSARDFSSRGLGRLSFLSSFKD